MRWFSNYFIHVWLLILNVVRLLQLSLRVVKLIFTWCVLIDLLPELMWHLWTVVDAKTRSRKHPPRFKWPSIFLVYQSLEWYSKTLQSKFLKSLLRQRPLNYWATWTKKTWRAFPSWKSKTWSLPRSKVLKTTASRFAPAKPTNLNSWVVSPLNLSWSKWANQ